MKHKNSCQIEPYNDDNCICGAGQYNNGVKYIEDLLFKLPRTITFRNKILEFGINKMIPDGYNCSYSNDYLVIHEQNKLLEKALIQMYLYLDKENLLTKG